MPEYAFDDGVLQGNVSSWPEVAVRGQTFTVRLVDVGQRESEQPEVDYAVTHTPDGSRPGRLRFVAARGSWPVRADPPL